MNIYTNRELNEKAMKCSDVNAAKANLQLESLTDSHVHTVDNGDESVSEQELVMTITNGRLMWKRLHCHPDTCVFTIMHLMNKTRGDLRWDAPHTSCT